MLTSLHKMLTASIGLLLLVQISLVQSQYYTVDPSSINVNDISFDTSNPYECNCDLTNGSCDYLCCCDSDCNSDTVSGWRSSGTCQINTNAHSFCSLEQNVFQIVNVGNRRNVEYSFFSNSTDHGVCVEVTPDPSEFSSSTLLTSSQLSYTLTDSIISGIRSQYTAPTNPTTTATSYRFGLNILLPNSAGYMTISTPDAFSNCEFTHRLRFGINEETRTCRIAITPSSCISDTNLDSSLLSTTEYIPSYSSKTTTANSSVYQVNVQDATTGVITPLAPADASSYLVTPTLNPSSGTTCTCNNVMVGLEEIISTTSSRITAVNYIPTVTDVSFACSDGVGYAYRTSSVTFVSSSAGLTEASLTSLTPGYIVGNPIRIGTRVNNYINIPEITYNLKGIDISGNCLDQGSISSSASGKTVLFGTSALYTCGLSITALSTFCSSSGSSGNWPNLGLFNNFIASSTYIGSFANSNPSYLKDYLLLTGTTLSGAGPSYDSTTQVCTMYTGATIDIFYSSVGYYEGYQNYIASARVSFDGQSQFFLSSNPQTVNFQFSINFVNIDQITAEFTSGTRPSFIPQLPDDILYPFFFPTEDGAASLAVSWGLVLVGLVVAGGVL